jgi:hypothetical protein
MPKPLLGQQIASGARVGAQVSMLLLPSGAIQIDIHVTVIDGDPGLEAAIGTRLRGPATDLGHAFARILREVHADHNHVPGPPYPPGTIVH